MLQKYSAVPPGLLADRPAREIVIDSFDQSIDLSDGVAPGGVILTPEYLLRMQVEFERRLAKDPRLGAGRAASPEMDFGGTKDVPDVVLMDDADGI